jgi:hypothetical protein
VYQAVPDILNVSAFNITFATFEIYKYITYDPGACFWSDKVNRLLDGGSPIRVTELTKDVVQLTILLNVET